MFGYSLGAMSPLFFGARYSAPPDAQLSLRGFVSRALRKFLHAMEKRSYFPSTRGGRRFDRRG